MKKIIILAIAAILTLGANAQQASKGEQTVTIQTNGVCQKCADKFKENVPYFKGVKSYSYDMKTAKLTINYDAKKTNPDQLRTEVSKLGYNADNVKADPAARAKLPLAVVPKKVLAVVLVMAAARVVATTEPNKRAAPDMPKAVSTNAPTPRAASTNAPTPKAVSTNAPTPKAVSTNAPMLKAVSTNALTPKAANTNALTPRAASTSAPTLRLVRRKRATTTLPMPPRPKQRVILTNIMLKATRRIPTE